MRKLSKTLLSLLLIAAMLASFVVLPAAAEEPSAVQEPAVETQAETTANDSFMKIFHLDCGRKYFTKDWIIALINEISAAGYTHLQLAIGNDGMRFLLDDMSLTVGDKTYSSEDVAAAIHAGNVAYDNRQSYTPEKDELTESEMNAIISYATSKGITVIPLINNPGHMDAILSAATSLTGTTCSYNGSVTTINLENEDAVAFTKAFLTKYVEYFAAKGCTHFGIGADEYANDVYSTGSMGFGQLVKDGNYDKFISYVNSVAALVKAAEMKPVAFNDGFYFNGNTTSGTFSTDIVISFWTSGWGGYQSETASRLAARGHQMINTNGDFYYVLGKSDKFDSGYDYASNFSNTAFMGSTVSNPAGATFCVWCDYPGAETEQEIAQKIRLPLRAMAQRMKGESVVLDENELVSGGFKADGTINAATVSDEATGVSVTASGLTGITVAAVDKGTELDGKKVAGAWNIELTTANGSYTDSATVSIPVGKEWLSYKLTGGVLESDGTTVTSDPNSKVENGVLTFTAPHFSTVVVLAEEKQVPITVTVGGTETVTVDGEVSSAYTDDFVTVKTETKNMTATPYYERAALGAGTFYISDEANDTAPTTKITITANGGGTYYLKNSNNRYIYPNGTYSWFSSSWSYEAQTSTNPQAVTISSNEDGSIIVSRDVSSTWGGTKTVYLCFYGGSLSGTATRTSLYLYNTNLVTPPASKQTTISFTGKKAGTTRVKIGDVLYIITVSPENLDNVSPLKIEYWITNSRLTGTTSSKNELSIAATLDGVASAEGVEIASLVDAQGAKDGRTQEYWQSKILDVQKSNDSTSGTELQTTKQGDDETLNGTAFTKVRYWDGKWQAFTNAWVDVDRTQVTVTYTGDSGSVRYKGDRNQLVAYYMEVVNINNENGESELHVNAADWGTKGDGTGSWGYTPESSRCSVSIQLVYEDGSFNPTDTTAAKLKSKTILYGYWSGGRGLGTMVFTGQQGYEIYKVTAETGNMTSTAASNYTVTVTNFTWDENEETVWEGDQTKSVSIGNPARKPSYEAPYDNLAWNTGKYNKNNAILIRVYVKAQIAEDSLIVHYVDKTTGKQFYEYGIKVKENTTFDPLFAKDKGNALVHNEVENYNGATQKVSAELKEMPQISAAYRYSKYTLVEVERKTDGKEVTLYYTFNNKHTFVVDFGVPLKIKATDIGVTVPAGDSYWTEATCTGAVYGETKIANGEGLTYTATKPMLGIETLNVTLATGTGEDDKATHTIYLVPATTVYYEQNVATYSDGWSLNGTAIAADKYQQTQKGRTTGYNFGYDPYYKENQLGANGSVMYTTTPGASAQLTFKGTGMELYLRTQNANATSDPATEANNATDHSYMLVQVYAGDTADANNLKRMSFVDVNNLFVAHGSDKYGYNTPCWTVDGMTYGTYTVVVRYVKGTTYGLAIDGFRVTNTLNPSDATTSGFYADVYEANMQTAEIRNMVLAKANVNNAIFGMSAPMYQVGVDEVLDAVFDDKDVISGATIIESNGTVNTNVTVDKDLVNIGPKNEIYLQQGQAVVMELTGNYASVQVGMRSLTGETVKYQINSEPTKEMNSTVDMYYKVKLVEGKLVIQNVSGGILALTRLKVTSAAAASTDDPGVVPQTTPEAIRYAMALMRGLEVPQFTDVPEDAWYHDYVYDLVYRGVVNGMTATTYEPAGTLTRAQFVKLLACSLADAETLKTYEGKHPFKDSEGHWAEAYIAWAKDKGIVEGVSATEFDPEAPITREQMATIFGRYALKQGIELPKDAAPAESFPDADKISEYAREFVELMRIAGILNGYEDGTFRPQGNATRAEAAKLFSLFLSITDKLAK